jgi:hypothetical protein
MFYFIGRYEFSVRFDELNVKFTEDDIIKSIHQFKAGQDFLLN